MDKKINKSEIEIKTLRELTLKEHREFYERIRELELKVLAMESIMASGALAGAILCEKVGKGEHENNKEKMQKCTNDKCIKYDTVWEDNCQSSGNRKDFSITDCRCYIGG